tara:strand:+ start:608 stop:1246 length:639 start_codon:yes stop_codon:yes gene_type:complete
VTTAISSFNFATIKKGLIMPMEWIRLSTEDILRIGRIAHQRDKQKRSYQSTRQWTKKGSTHFSGCWGEVIWEKQTGLKMDEALKKRGDDGWDNKHGGKKINVKAVEHKQPHLKLLKGEKALADLYVLVQLEEKIEMIQGTNRKDVALWGRVMGWSTRDELLAATIKDYGRGPTKAIEWWNLHDGLPPGIPNIRPDAPEPVIDAKPEERPILF